MTNEERIYKLCEFMIDIINELSYVDRACEKNLEWVKDELFSIRQDIENSN